ncbi:MAG: flagellar protein FliS [Defluviitaleaceae bacterium]|nr:flagellar protein FliS [Defluviitaleaceae bacterium]
MSDTMTKTDYAARIAGADPLRLVLINFEIAFGFVRRAGEADPDSGEWGYAVDRVRNAVKSLICGLDFEYEPALDLCEIYHYVDDLLNEIRRKRNKDRLREVEMILRPLYEGFAEAENAWPPAAPVMDNAQKVYAGLTYRGGRLSEYVEEEWGRGFRG